MPALELLGAHAKTPEQIAAVDIKAIFDRLNLVQHVSANRRNGLFAMVEKLQSYGEAARP